MTDDPHGAADLGQPRGESTSEGSTGPFRHHQLQWKEGLFLAAIIVHLGLVVHIQRRDTDGARALKNFLSSISHFSISHELRTPIADTRLEVKVLADRASAHNRADSQLLRMLDGVYQLQTEFERALDLATLELGGQSSTRHQPIMVTFRTVPSTGHVHYLLVRNNSETPADSGSTDASSKGCPPFTSPKVRIHLDPELMRRIDGKAHLRKVLDRKSESGFEAHLTFQKEHHHG